MNMSEFNCVANKIQSLQMSTYVLIQGPNYGVTLDRRNSEYVSHQRILFFDGHGIEGLVILKNYKNTIVVFNDATMEAPSRYLRIACGFPVKPQDLIPRCVWDYFNNDLDFSKKLLNLVWLDPIEGFELKEVETSRGIIKKMLPVFSTKRLGVVLRSSNYIDTIDEDKDDNDGQEFQPVD